MKYVGIDLHKRIIVLCVVNGKRAVQARRRFRSDAPEALEAFLRDLGEFFAVVEATAAYEWFVRLVEPLTARVVLAHPYRLRVIAESRQKAGTLQLRDQTTSFANQAWDRSLASTHDRFARHHDATT